MLRLTVFVCLLKIVVINAQYPPFDVVFEWNLIDYNWPLSESRLANRTTDYIAENNAIAGIKLWKDRLYLTIPRWKNGVPVTLAVTSAIPLNNQIAPKLDPYPNWEMQIPGDCDALQSVQSMEIDPKGRMWVIDTGRTETMSLNPGTKCPPRLVILDLENNGTVLLSYVFPDEVARKDSAYLNDIVLDHEDGGMAYITDSGRGDSGIIVYSLKENASWKVTHDSMKAQIDAVGFVVDGTIVNVTVDVDGIALSPPGKNRRLFYSPLSSFYTYSIPVWVLKNMTVGNVDHYVRELGRKSSQSDGMIMTNEGVLYFGLLAEDKIAMWNKTISRSFKNGLSMIPWNHALIHWPDTFGIDEAGRLYCVTNALQSFMAGKVNASVPNYRVLRSLTTAKNYQYYEDGSAPELPELPELPVINAATIHNNFVLLNCLIIVIALFTI